jgi:TonB family protein
VELTLRRVARLPKGESGIALTEMAEIIRRRGVDFRLEPPTEQSLRRLGANLAVLSAVRDSYRPAREGEYTAEEAERVKTPPARALATAMSAGVLNSRAVTPPQLVLPPAAKAAGVSGMVNVSVLVDEEGTVVSAKAVSGHPLLHRAAEEAALATKIKPLTSGGKQLIMQGLLIIRP